MTHLQGVCKYPCFFKFHLKRWRKSKYYPTNMSKVNILPSFWLSRRKNRDWILFNHIILFEWMYLSPAIFYPLLYNLFQAAKLILPNISSQPVKVCHKKKYIHINVKVTLREKIPQSRIKSRSYMAQQTWLLHISDFFVQSFFSTSVVFYMLNY